MLVLCPYDMFMAESTELNNLVVCLSKQNNSADTHTEFCRSDYTALQVMLDQTLILCFCTTPTD